MLGFKGTWEGARPVELSFLLCSDSSLGGFGKVLRGISWCRRKKSLGVGDEAPLSIHQSMRNSSTFSRACHLGELFNPIGVPDRAQGLGKCLQAEKTKCITFKTRKMSK